MRSLHRFSIQHPVLTVVIATVVTLAIAPGILRLRLRTDGHALVPEHAPAIRIDREIRNEFGVRDPIVVLVRTRHPDGIFNRRTLRLVSDLTARFARLPGLDTAHVRSLASEPSDHFRPGTLKYRFLLEPLPETRAALDSLRADIDAIGLLTGTLVSSDASATAVLVGTPPVGDRTALLFAVHEAIARTDTAGHVIDVIGAPVAEALLGSHILEDLGVSWRAPGMRLESAADPSGDAGVRARLRGWIARHLGLLPLSIVVMTLVFILCFRSVSATLLPLAEVGACLVVVFGLMGWTGVPVYLTMAVLPVILVSMGLADEIHVFTCYSRHLNERPEAPIPAAVREALDDMSLPVVATSLTTAIGFLSFALSPLPPVRAFGVFTAAGILFCMLWTLTVIPALLVLVAPRAFRAPGTGGAPSPGFGAWGALAGAVARRPVLTLAIAALGIALTPLGIRRLVVQDSWISGFGRDSGFYRATQYFNHHFHGTHRLLVALDTGRIERHGTITPAEIRDNVFELPGDLVPEPRMLAGCSLIVARRALPADPSSLGGSFLPTFWGSIVDSAARRGARIVVTTPLYHGSPVFLMQPAPEETLEYSVRSQRLALPAVLRRIDDFERFARTHTRHAVGGVLGPPDQIRTAEFLMSYREPGTRGIPNDLERVIWLWKGIELVQGPERLRETVDPKLRRGLVTIFLKNANYVDTDRLMKALRAYESAHLLPERIRFDFAGDVAVSQALIESIVRSQLSSLLASLLGILVLTSVIFRSLRWGLVCMMPAALAVAATFAGMGWTGMPLGVATSMFAAMVLGIGVDFAIHLVARFRQSLARGASRELATLDALAATGPAIVVNALAVGLGFGILVFSQVPANARLGAIAVMSLLACLAGTLLVIPALLRVAGRRGASAPTG